MFTIAVQKFARLRKAYPTTRTKSPPERIAGFVACRLSYNRCLRKLSFLFLLMFNDKEEAAYYLNDLEQMIGENDVLFYPGSYRGLIRLKKQIMPMFCFAPKC